MTVQDCDSSRDDDYQKDQDGDHPREADFTRDAECPMDFEHSSFFYIIFSCNLESLVSTLDVCNLWSLLLMAVIFGHYF